MTEDVKRTYLLLLVPLLVIVLLIAALATSAAAAPGYDSEQNHPEYWGDDCTKTEDALQGSRWYTPVNEGYRLVVLKSSTTNDVFHDVPAGAVLTTVSGKDISHVIYCGSDPVITIPPTTTTEKPDDEQPPATTVPPAITTTVPVPVTTVPPVTVPSSTVPPTSTAPPVDVPDAPPATPVDSDPEFTG